MKKIDIVGKKFGRLLVLARADKEIELQKSKKKYSYYFVCLCDCGNQKIIERTNLVSGDSKSCGCLHREGLLTRSFKHGQRKTRLYKIHTAMMSRCYRQKDESYKNYGARGIKVVTPWHTFLNFYNDMSNSYYEHVSLYGEEQTSIDRIDNNKSYSKENCRWATRKQQGNNKKNNRFITFNGKTQTLAQWVEELKINQGTLYRRLQNWNVKDAFTKPIDKD